ncbi:hypothetical protein P3X46_028531 [Hevea brasiliensis]|uniref:Protein kinase domain-containing protein n=1 Tax=Hevea brasiliensis TaxID=3981 RepID=A0ABQ9KR23_HEVBR|nr:hypothetical protein P3X46_028531 [Hevea brasiliensis]
MEDSCGMCKQFLLLAVISAAITASTAQAIPGCPDHCSDLIFLTTCNASNAAFLGNTGIQVLNISVEGQLRNKLIAIGCDTFSYIQGSRPKGFVTGCISYCEQFEDLINGSCLGRGCCQSSIPREALDFYVSIISLFNHEHVWKFNPCSYTFVVEENAYNFSTKDFADLWNANCPDNNSLCQDFDNVPGYRCSCSEGYWGNPYLADGCKDVNNCEIPSLNLCTNNCENIMGNYTCYCPNDYHGYGRKDGRGCSPNNNTTTNHTVAIIAKKRVFQAKRWFLVESKHSADAAKIFAEGELKKATNNFNKNMVIGQGGYGVVYKGILSDNRVVAIKKSKAIDRTQIEQFVNEVIILSQIHHPNAVKLLGCCLETPVPLLVYDFISNGTLFHHLHDAACIHSLSWETRFRMAEETAGALAYMHSMQIIHRDIKSANILLDDEFTAKVSDFGVSRLVSFDQEQISTLAQGMLGYIDPEYFQSGILTEKSDIYSFGVVLEKSAALYFISSLKDKRLFDILEHPLKAEGNSEEVQEVADLARNCLRLEGEQRPTMKELVEDLEILRQSRKQQQMILGHNSQENQTSMS